MVGWARTFCVDGWVEDGFLGPVFLGPGYIRWSGLRQRVIGGGKVARRGRRTLCYVIVGEGSGGGC